MVNVAFWNIFIHFIRYIYRVDIVGSHVCMCFAAAHLLLLLNQRRACTALKLLICGRKLYVELVFTVRGGEYSCERVVLWSLRLVQSAYMQTHETWHACEAQLSLFSCHRHFHTHTSRSYELSGLAALLPTITTCNVQRTQSQHLIALCSYEIIIIISMQIIELWK